MKNGFEADSPAIEFRLIAKSFGQLQALVDVNFAVKKGAIHGILGENGAGKTTLMNIIYGLYRPTSGTVLVDNVPCVFHSPADAIRHGIGMIHQHFQLANSMNVVENVILGTGGSVRLNMAKAENEIKQIAAEFDFEIDARSEVWKLPVGMRQRVEIIKALYRKAQILVLDEPTSVLAPEEISNFLKGLKKLRDSGKTILFITHKLEEVMAVCDTVTVMRKGAVVSNIAVKDTSLRELAASMIDRPAGPRKALQQSSGVEILRLKNIVTTNDRGTPALRRVSLELREGEILGITGVDGNGQRELAETIVGLRKVESGVVVFAGADISSSTIGNRIRKHKIGFVPEDRHDMGLVLDLPVSANYNLKSFSQKPFSRFGMLNFKAMREAATQMVDEYDVRPADAARHVRLLSGGNQQKIILAREISLGPKLLVIMQATKGLDVGAIAFVQSKIIEQRNNGVAVLYISTELEHVLEVSDRISVMFAGTMTSSVMRQDATIENIGAMMLGLASGATS